MKRFIVFVIGLAFASGVLAFNTDKPPAVPSSTQPAKTTAIKVHRETRVSFTGIVKEISDTTLLVERSVKDNVETMEFTLDKPAEDIKAGDKIKVSYIKKDGKNIVRKVSPFTVKKIINKTESAKEIKVTTPEAPPSRK